MEIRDESTLSEILAQLDRSKIDRPEEVITRVVEAPDFELKDHRIRLEAKRREGGGRGRILAKMPWGAAHVYQLITEDRELGIHFENAFGRGIASCAHHLFRLKGEGRQTGTIHYFPNTSFIFTNKEPCTGLFLIEFEGEQLVFYRASTPGFLRPKHYAVVTTASGELVAVIVEVNGWIWANRYLKLHRPCHDVFVALLMATFHGLVFRTSSSL